MLLHFPWSTFEREVYLQKQTLTHLKVANVPWRCTFMKATRDQTAQRTHQYHCHSTGSNSTNTSTTTSTTTATSTTTSTCTSHSCCFWICCSPTTLLEVISCGSCSCPLMLDPLQSKAMLFLVHEHSIHDLHLLFHFFNCFTVY